MLTFINRFILLYYQALAKKLLPSSRLQAEAMRVYTLINNTTGKENGIKIIIFYRLI